MFGQNSQPEQGPILTVELSDQLGNPIPAPETCATVCNLNGTGFFTTNDLALNWFQLHDYLFDFVVCPQFTLPPGSCGIAQLGADGCWHFWGGTVTPPQPPYPVPIDFTCYFSQPGSYVMLLRAWPDFPLDGLPDANFIAESDTACINIQNATDLTTIPITINPAAPYCINTPITFSIPNNIAASADFIQWGVTEPGATVETLYSCSAMSCTTFILNPTMGGIYTVNVYVNYNGINCPQFAMQTTQVQITYPCCLTQAPPDSLSTTCCILATANTYFAQPNGSPHFTVTSSQTWQPGAGNHPFTGFAGTAANPIRVNGTITVNPSVAVSMQNLNFEFGPNGRIVVEPTASMDISGCNLTGDPVCQTMWQGIRVVGSGYDVVPDPAVNAGRLNIRHTHILHALIGVANSRLPLFNFNEIAFFTGDESVHPFVNFTSQVFQAIWYNVTFQSSGGVVTTDHADFVNCFHGINLTWQSKPYGTIIDNAIFRHDNSLAPNGNLWYPFNTVSQSEAGIFILYYGHETTISNSVFNNIKYGIRANVFRTLTIQRNNFNLCEIGVSARTFDSTFPTMAAVLDNNFEDCYIGIQVDGGNARIYRNNINHQNPNPLAYRWYNGDVTAGMLLRATSFYVGNNPTNKNYIDNVTFGIIPINNVSLSGTINNNQLTNSSASVFALGNNRNVAISCNDLHNYQLFGLGLAAWNTVSGVLPQQGFCNTDEPAGNSFIPATPIVYTDLWRDVPNSTGFVYEDINTTVLTATTGITVNECTEYIGNIEYLCAGLEGIRSREEIIAEPDEARRNQEGSRLMETYLGAGDTTEALQLLQDLNTKEAMRLLSSEYIDRNQFSLAESILNNLPRQTQEDEDFYRLQNVLIDLVANGQEVFNINLAQEDTLLAIASNHTHTAYLAQSLLYAAKGHEFPIQLPQIEGLQGSGYTAFKLLANKSEMFVLYPNPATNQVYLSYQLSATQIAQFLLYDINGRILYTATLTGKGTHTFSTNMLESGIYYYTVAVNGATLKRQKLLIAK